MKLLTPQEEIELAARIKKGDKKARVTIKPPVRGEDRPRRDRPAALDLIVKATSALKVERFDPAGGNLPPAARRIAGPTNAPRQPVQNHPLAGASADKI